MENISNIVIVCSFVWSYAFFFIALFLAIVWGEYLWKKGKPARIAKSQRRLDDLKKLCAMERRVGYRRA